MEINHVEALRIEFPTETHKVYLLGEMAGHPYSIPDPYGGTLAQYQRMAAELAQLIDAGLARIIELARENENRRPKT